MGRKLDFLNFHLATSDSVHLNFLREITRVFFFEKSFKGGKKNFINFQSNFPSALFKRAQTSNRYRKTTTAYVIAAKRFCHTPPYHISVYENVVLLHETDMRYRFRRAKLFISAAAAAGDT